MLGAIRRLEAAENSSPHHGKAVMLINPGTGLGRVRPSRVGGDVGKKGKCPWSAWVANQHPGLAASVPFRGLHPCPTARGDPCLPGAGGTSPAPLPSPQGHFGSDLSGQD